MKRRPEDFDAMILQPGAWRGVSGVNADDPPSIPWEPMKLAERLMSQEGYPCHVWENARYSCRVTFLPRSHGTLFGHEVVRLGIQNEDQSARRDWRDFMAIKRDVLGPDWEAIELYPHDGRICDPSNYFILYAIRGEFPFGIAGPSRVCQPEDAIAPQRGFA
jgi:hypothetical protein